MHKNVAPQASIWIDPAIDIDPVLEGIQVKLGDTFEVIDTSSDPNRNIHSIMLKWGDGETAYLTPGEAVTHSYGKAGKKTITVTAMDSKGLKSKKVKQKITIIKPESGVKSMRQLSNFSIAFTACSNTSLYKKFAGSFRVFVFPLDLTSSPGIKRRRVCKLLSVIFWESLGKHNRLNQLMRL